MLTKIYIVTNCYGDLNKVYIGKTKNNKRHFAHKQTFGKNIIFNYIDEVNSLDKNDWKPLECKWIQHYKDLGYEVLNKNKGGNGADFLTEETKLRIGLSKKGHKCYLSKTWKDNISKSLKNKPKPIGFGLGKICSQKTKEKMREAALGKVKTEEQKQKMRKPHPKTNKPVIQYNIQGNFIKEWSSISEISKELNKQGAAISECCNNKRKTAYKYKWKFK